MENFPHIYSVLYLIVENYIPHGHIFALKGHFLLLKFSVIRGKKGNTTNYIPIISRARKAKQISH